MGDPRHRMSPGITEEPLPGQWVVTYSCSCGWQMSSEGNSEDVALRNALGYAEAHRHDAMVAPVSGRGRWVPSRWMRTAAR